MDAEPQVAQTVQNVQALIAELRDAVAEMDEMSASYRPGDGEWSVKEIVCHLRDANDIFYARLKRMRDETNPYLRAVNTDQMAVDKNYMAEAWRDVWPGFKASAEANIAHFMSLSAAGWQRVARHEELGPITVADIPAILRDHLHAHVAQVRRTKERNALRQQRQNTTYRRYDYGNDEEDESERDDRRR